jgi:hypothetical protein
LPRPPASRDTAQIPWRTAKGSRSSNCFILRLLPMPENRTGKAEKCLQEQTAAGTALGLFGGGDAIDFRILTEEARSIVRGGRSR